MERLFTPQEVADQLKIKKNTVYELIKRGELKSSKIGKQIRISENQVQAYLGQASVVSEPPKPVADAAAANPTNPINEYQARPLKSDASYPESGLVKRDFLTNTNGLIISGQDGALDLICSMIEDYPTQIPTLRSILNSYNGLYSLYFEKTHIAGIDLWDDKSNQQLNRHSTAFIKSLMPGIPVTLIHILKQPIGFYVKMGNPKNIAAFKDLARADICFANREKGSGPRMYFDNQLGDNQLTPDNIRGYQQEFLSAFSCAKAVAADKADVALGNESTLIQFPMLEFIPLDTTRLDLVFPTANIHHPSFIAFLEVLKSEQLKSTLSYLKGCDITQTGDIIQL